MSIMPDGPTFNHESAGLPADDPAVAFSAAPLQVAAAGDFQSSPAPFLGSLPSGESDPSVTLDCGAGETFVPPICVSIERDLLELVMRRLADYANRADDLKMPAFLRNPSPEYLNAIQRAAE